ncbi:hypothetical protein BH11BAC1_BH11BAC1_10200 [soil metagenome]
MKNLFFLWILGYSLINTASAQWNLDTLVRNPISTSGSPEGGIIMLNDPTGGIYITWLQADNNGRGTIMAQRLDNYGNKLWNTTGKVIVPGSIGGYYTRNFITPSDSGSFMVVWKRAGDDLCAQRFDSNGDTLFAPYKKLYTPFSGNFYETYTLPDDSGGAMIIFEESSILKEMRIDKNGTALWQSPKTLALLSSCEGIFPDRENGALYFYQPGTPIHTCYLQHVDRNGINKWANPVTISSTGNFLYQVNSCIEYDQVSGGCFFMYQNTTNYTNYLQYVDTAGNFRWSNGGLPVTNSMYNEVVPDGQGGVYHSYVIYYSPDTTHAQYVVKHYDQNGTSLWNSQDTIVYSPSITSLLHQDEDSYHRLVLDNSGGVIITWDEFRNNRLCIYGQRYNASGNKMWRNDGFPVITANNQLGTNGCGIPCDNLNHKLISFGDSSAVAAWQDSRHGNQNNPDIYVALTDGVFSTGIEDDFYELSTLNLYPNPAGTELNLEFSKSAYRQIQISNTMGEIIFQTSMNDNHLIMDTKDFQTGIYFISIRQGTKYVVVKKFAKI